MTTIELDVEMKYAKAYEYLIKTYGENIKYVDQSVGIIILAIAEVAGYKEESDPTSYSSYSSQNYEISNICKNLVSSIRDNDSKQSTNLIVKGG